MQNVWKHRSLFLADPVPFAGRPEDLFVGDTVFHVVHNNKPSAYDVVMCGSALLAAAGVAPPERQQPGTHSPRTTAAAQPALDASRPPSASATAATAAAAATTSAGGSGRAPLSAATRSSLVQAARRAWPPSNSKHDHLKYLVARWMIDTLQPDTDLRFRALPSQIGGLQPR